MPRLLFDIFDVAFDAKTEYVRYRRRGLGREEAIKNVLADFARELEDVDDRPVVWLGLAAAAAAKQELTEELKAKGEEALIELRPRFSELLDRDALTLEREIQSICSASRIGPEAKYPKKREFKLDWQIGDTFALQLNSALAARFGIQGQYLIVRKIGEYLNYDDDWDQLVYLSLCPEEQFAGEDTDVGRLGYLSSAKRRNGYDYVYKLDLTSAKKAKFYDFIPIGNFRDVDEPKNAAPVDPLVAYLVFADNCRSGVSFLEMTACCHFRDRGVL